MRYKLFAEICAALRTDNPVYSCVDIGMGMGMFITLNTIGIFKQPCIYINIYVHMCE